MTGGRLGVMTGERLAHLPASLWVMTVKRLEVMTGRRSGVMTGKRLAHLLASLCVMCYTPPHPLLEVEHVFYEQGCSDGPVQK